MKNLKDGMTADPFTVRIRLNLLLSSSSSVGCSLLRFALALKFSSYLTSSPRVIILETNKIGLTDQKELFFGLLSLTPG